jgi:hypothetical protein
MNSTSSLDAQGALQSGSANNLRWQIVNSNTASGTFNLLVRRGDDNTNVPIVLETWTNLSLDPTQPNYIEKVIGNQIFGVGDSTNTFVTASGNYPNKSNYITVKSVNFKTPNYFDNVVTLNLNIPLHYLQTLVDHLEELLVHYSLALETNIIKILQQQTFKV